MALGTAATLSALDGQKGLDQALAPYQSTQGQRVLDSFDPATHWGVQNPLADLGMDAGIAVTEAALARLGWKLFPKKGPEVKATPKEPPSNHIDTPDHLLPDNIAGDGLGGHFVQEAVSDVRAGRLPGRASDGLGSPREMPQTLNPNETAERFAMEFFGGSKPAHAKPLGDGAWSAETTDGIYVTYRPAGKASGATKNTTASVDLNSKSISVTNANAKLLKLKFPMTGNTGVGIR